MKKLILAMMAVAAITLTSCLGKTSTPGQGDPQAEAPNEVSELTKALESQLNSGNGEGFFGLVTNIQEKAIGFIKDNPEKAKEYLGTAQKFLRDNSAKIGELLGKISNTEIAERAQDFIKSVTEQPVDQLLGVMGVVGGAQEAVGEQVDSVKNAVGEKIDEVTGAVDEVKGAVDQKVNDVKNVINQAEDVKDAIGNVLGN